MKKVFVLYALDKDEFNPYWKMIALYETREKAERGRKALELWKSREVWSNWLTDVVEREVK